MPFAFCGICTRGKIDSKAREALERRGYEAMERLGKGGFGKVYKVERVSDGEIFACKVIDKPDNTNFITILSMPDELKALMDIRHPNITVLYDIISLRNRVLMVMEYCSGGDVMELMENSGMVPLSEPRSRFIFKQLAEAVRFIHEEKGIAHRDIKEPNILLTDNNIVKLTDFGFAIKARDEDGNVIMSRAYCGTVPYMCLEIIKKDPYDPFQADIWAMGVTLFFMTHSYYPFNPQYKYQMLIEQQRPDQLSRVFERNISPELKDLLTGMLNYFADERPTIAQVIGHEWMNRREEPVRPKARFTPAGKYRQIYVYKN